MNISTTSPRVSHMKGDPFLRTLAKDIKDLWRPEKAIINPRAVTAGVRIFRVVGVIRAEIVPVVTEAFVAATGSPVLSFTYSGTSAGIIGATAPAALTNGVIWSATTGNVAVRTDSSIIRIVSAATDLHYVVATNAFSAGQVTFYVRWQPISTNGDLITV